MIRKTASICMLYTAFAVLLAHALVPHHHHGNEHLHIGIGHTNNAEQSNSDDFGLYDWHHQHTGETDTIFYLSDFFGFQLRCTVPYDYEYTVFLNTNLFPL